MAPCNTETDDMLSKLKTFETLCAAFPVRVRELVRELNGEYGLCRQECSGGYPVGTYLLNFGTLGLNFGTQDDFTL